ncbi:MAG: hypothetical protein C5B59_08640 [Bacteroidetes bacterium]|nr:MAG: hypothetical protein C5B59_08640 [Bacteroidota bacterium]
MSQIQGAGGQPQKSPKYAPIYTGRIFNGLYTNRSPLRGVSPALYEQYYRVSYGDVMIAGANVEVSNRLTLIRRPGNPNYDANSWNNVLSFDEFRVNKSASDVFGTTLENIYTMVTEPGTLFSLDSSLVKSTVFTNSAVNGQTFMQEVGNSLYFSNGVDNKKWLQSLFVRNSGNNNANPQGTNGLAGTYPFGTYFIDANKNIEELIGIAAATITNVAVTSDVLTLTLNMASPNSDTHNYSVGTSFMIWGVNTQTWLNGLIVTSTNSYTAGAGTWAFSAKVVHNDVVSAAETGWAQQIGTTPVIAVTGNSVPTFHTAILNSSNNSGATAPTGNVTLDGNILWFNRGGQVENWGIQAPTSAITTSETGSSTVGWKASTYYSAPGVVIDSNNNIWQVTTAGTTGGSNPFPANPTVGQTQVDGTVTWTCVSTNVSSNNMWAAHTGYKEGVYQGSAPWTVVTTPPDGSFLPDWKSGKFIIATASGTPCLFMLQKNIPLNNVNVPISAVFGGGAYNQVSSPYTTAAVGWTCAFFNHADNTSNHTNGLIDLDWGGSVGSPVLYGTSTPQTPTANATGLTSIIWDIYRNGSSGHSYDVHPMKLQTMNSAGEVTDGTATTPWAGMPSDVFEFLQWGRIRVPVSGMNVTFTIPVNDACFFGIESTAGATFVSFSSSGSTGGLSNLGHMGTRTRTPWNGYPILAGWNGGNNGDTLTIVINFPVAGVFGIEFAYGKASGGSANTHNFFMVVANGSHIVPESATAQPWFESGASTPGFGGTGWNLLSAPQDTYPGALENNPPNPAWTDTFNSLTPPINGNQLKWYNLGPVTDFTWRANTPITLPSTIIIDKNSNEQTSYETGVSGTTQPTWQTTKFSLTADQTPLQWINLGSIPPVNNGTGQITATTSQGWIYWIALVNTLDQTVSNLNPASAGTGPIIAGQIAIPAGSGIDLTTLDPQVDYVAVFRTTDGGSTPLLVNGLGNSFYTVPLTQYLQNGYIDTTPDTDLDEQVQGAQNGENTPPATGTVNLTYHLNRIWYSVGNSVYYTTGPLALSGNGNGTTPTNVSTLPSQVKRLVPTAIGMLVFTVSDIYIIAGNGTTTNPILPAIPYLTGVGLANYNALDINGGLIGFYTTDKQFVIFNPSAGLDYAGFPIGDQLRLNNGVPGQTWNSSKVYVTWYTNGEDQAWFLGDGVNGWYKYIQTPAPETGTSWSPFATINGGQTIQAIRAIEVSPGVHKLLVGPGPLTTGAILTRDLTATTDAGTTGINGTTYFANAVFGSYVLALPGQVAKIGFVTTKSVRVNGGSPLVIGLLLDEALPYYQGSFDVIKRWVNDPPELPESKTFWNQRFYLSEDPDKAAYCTDMQLQVIWPAEAAMNELQAFSIWGAYEVEQ